MPNKLQVMMDEILQKKFSKRIHSGYDPEDVDKFFDYVITYLNEVNINSARLFEKLKETENENRQLKEQLEQKNNSINALNGQIEYFRREGYDNQRQSSEMTYLRDKVAELEKNIKK
jgi:DivIVA domain-containing protein